MRVAIITESFLPAMNGVTNSVLRVVEHLTRHGHRVLVVAPDAPGLPRQWHGARVVGMASVGLPGYPQVRLAATPRLSLESTLAEFRPHVVHLASPINAGYRGLLAAEGLGLPTVAVYQTDVPAYAARYKVPALEQWLGDRVRRIHTSATLNLAPSTSGLAALARLGVTDAELWGRGVDGVLFHPGRRDEALRRQVAPPHHRLVGYLGRLAPEKQVADLHVLADLPDTTTVVIGDGPDRAELETRLPGAVFLGELRGEPLARALASLDVFVHPGELETFGQTIQEAMASGVPVIAPASGGPVDLVDPSRTGWLYPPGRLDELRRHVRDLTGDDVKRRAFGATARRATEPRTWAALGARLVGHYESAIARKRDQLDHDARQEAGQLLRGVWARVGPGRQRLDGRPEQGRLAGG